MDSTDAELALITKGIKRFWKGKDIGGNASSNNRGMQVEVSKDSVFYTCGEKGHITRNCTRKKVETALKKDKSMTTTWGESDLDEEQERNPSNCLLVDNEVTSLSNLSKFDLI